MRAERNASKRRSNNHSFQEITVIVPVNPFVPADLQNVRHCLAALDVEKLMNWWPGEPHGPNRDAQKVRAIQRSLDWKRVARIASYLLQKEIVDVPERLDHYFKDIYEPKKLEPGREWPPKVSKVIGYERSEYPTFSNVLLHINGARIEPLPSPAKTANLIFDETDPDVNFSVIDGQHRINGAFFAIKLLREEKATARWEIPAEIFLDLDEQNSPPRRQAQIFIDVNFYQKKVDRSLVADLFPTARGPRGPLDDMERSQDLGRKLMLEIGPLVGMIQIPGVKFGVKDVVTLATLNSAIEDIINHLFAADIESLDAQAEFLAQCLDAWLEATGRKREVVESEKIEPQNVAYQGRVIVSFLTLIPACIWQLKKTNEKLMSDAAKERLTKWLRGVMDRAGLIENNLFLPKEKFKEKGFLGSGGLARFRDRLWAAALSKTAVSRLGDKKISELASKNRGKVRKELGA